MMVTISGNAVEMTSASSNTFRPRTSKRAMAYAARKDAASVTNVVAVAKTTELAKYRTIGTCSASRPKNALPGATFWR